MAKETLQELGIVSLDQLVDPDYLQRIKRRFRASTGIDVIVGKPGMRELFTQPEVYRFCAELSQDDEFKGRCWEVYFKELDEREDVDGVFSFPCHIGMSMFGAKIQVDGETLGFMGGCQVRPCEEHITREGCASLCQRFRYQGDEQALYESSHEMPVYTGEQLDRTLGLFQEMAAALSEIAKRQLEVKREHAKRERLARYFSPSILELIESRGTQVEFSGEATVLFSDIRGFTSISETMEPRAVVEMLNEYFEEMVDAVFAHQGTLDKFIGDAVLAVFGAPVPTDSNARNALLAAQEMLERLDRLNRRRAEHGLPAIRIGIGIHTGKILGGNIGSSKRIEYTVIGDTVNVASRLESISKNYPEAIIVSDQTFALVKDLVESAGQEEIQLKGKSGSSRIHRIRRVRRPSLA